MTNDTNDGAAAKPVRTRKVIHATCTKHGGSRGFTNVVLTKRGDEIELDPPVTGSCVITFDEDAASGPGHDHGVAGVSARAVHLLPAGELFEQGYPNTPVTVCGEPVTSRPDGGEVEPSYCPEWVSAALRRNVRPGVVL